MSTMNSSTPQTAQTDGAPNPVAYGERRFGAVNWRGVGTLYQKEVRRFLKVAFQTVFAPVISTLLFLFVFMQAFGVDRAPVNGVPYIEFLAPGLVMLAILTNSFANSSSSLIIGKVQGSIVDVVTPPLSAAELTAALEAAQNSDTFTVIAAEIDREAYDGRI